MPFGVLSQIIYHYPMIIYILILVRIRVIFLSYKYQNIIERNVKQKSHHRNLKFLP